MEQAQRKRAHLERILLICGNQNSGKSTQLRHFRSDPRLGGVVGNQQGPIAPLALSRERRLAIRMTSPHEFGDSPADFHAKLDRVCEKAWQDGFWRINYASAVQPRAFKKKPGIVDVCAGLIREFQPERIRVVQLAPDWHGQLSSQLTTQEVDGLRKFDDVEVITIDARPNANRNPTLGNIRILADFFDFS